VLGRGRGGPHLAADPYPPLPHLRSGTPVLPLLLLSPRLNRLRGNSRESGPNDSMRVSVKRELSRIFPVSKNPCFENDYIIIPPSFSGFLTPLFRR
jgi:hypothetical protein